MSNTKLALVITGHLKVTKITNGIPTVLYDDHNTLTADWFNIVRRALGNGDATLEFMRAFKGGIELAQVPVTAQDYPVSALNNEVKLTALFDEASFDDTLDEFRLSTNLFGDFSAVVGLSIEKDSDTQLSLDWTLTINNC